MTPSIMIAIRTVRMIRKFKNVLQVHRCSWWLSLQQISYIFGNIRTIQLNGGDSRYHDHHQDSQDDPEDQECPPGTRMFLMTLFARNTHVSYIFGNIRSNPDWWWWLQVSSWLSGRSGRSGRSLTSSKYKDVINNFICEKYPCIIYFWKPQIKSKLMVVTPGILINIRKIRNVLQVQRCSLWLFILSGSGQLKSGSGQVQVRSSQSSLA